LRCQRTGHPSRIDFALRSRFLIMISRFARSQIRVVKPSRVGNVPMHAIELREPVSALTHGIGFLLAIPGTWILVRLSRGDLGKRLSMLVYGLSLIFCYGASTLYHGVRVPVDSLGPYIRLDSAGIFALIAGSYTPMAWNLMTGRWRSWSLALVWGAAGLAIALLGSGHRIPTNLATAIFLGMGWSFAVCYARIAKVVSHRELRAVVAGGLFYSVGAVLNVIHWPSLWPGVFGTHELFHLFVIAGSLAHYRFLLTVVVPFARMA